MASIQLDGISVEFRLYDPGMRSIRRQVIEGLNIGGVFSSGERQKKPSIIALNNVSLDLEAGDRVALIGHNGAGKTTLLRVMAGIYEPSRGRALVDGRISPIFDVQLGMDKEATGYENIALRGLLLGMTRSEIDASTEDIANFSELGPFLNMPLHTYSTGMALRLAFAISTSIEPEILLLDEWIGAGDKSFIEKAQYPGGCLTPVEAGAPALQQGGVAGTGIGQRVRSGRGDPEGLRQVTGYSAPPLADPVEQVERRDGGTATDARSVAGEQKRLGPAAVAQALHKAAQSLDLGIHIDQRAGAEDLFPRRCEEEFGQARGRPFDHPQAGP
jgi:ABC-type polysaccharide/polyol phosphate transport system ATPase subunit